MTQLGQQNGNLNLEPSCEDQKCPIFLQSHTSIPANLDSSDSAQQIIAEVGVQASTFPSAAELTSWVGTCPGKNESAEQNHSSRSAKGNKYLRRVLNQAAHAAVKNTGSYFQSVFRRLLPRLGYQSAIWAIAHRLCRVVWKILHEGVRFIEQGCEPDPQAKKKRAQMLARALRRLGYDVAITPTNLAIAENGMQI